MECAEARSREAWYHTAKIMQLIADVGAPDTAPHKLSLFHPWLKDEPVKRKPYKPSDLRAAAAEYWRKKGKKPPAEWESGA